MKNSTLAAGGLFLAAITCIAAITVPFARGGQEPAVATTWEYKVVGMVDMHESTLDYLKGALTAEGGPIGKAKAADEQMAQKTEDLLNELGAEGWELVHYTRTSLIMKR